MIFRSIAKILDISKLSFPYIIQPKTISCTKIKCRINFFIKGSVLKQIKFEIALNFAFNEDICVKIL